MAEQVLRGAFAALERALAELNPYIGHKPGCTYDMSAASPFTDFCSCGLGSAKKHARDALAEAKAALPEGRSD